MLARLHINAFRLERISEEDSEDMLAAAAASILGDNIVGSAVYVLPSTYNHDCDRHFLPLCLNPMIKKSYITHQGFESNTIIAHICLIHVLKSALFEKSFGTLVLTLL